MMGTSSTTDLDHNSSKKSGSNLNEFVEVQVKDAEGEEEEKEEEEEEEEDDDETVGLVVQKEGETRKQGRKAESWKQTAENRFVKEGEAGDDVEDEREDYLGEGQGEESRKQGKEEGRRKQGKDRKSRLQKAKSKIWAPIGWIENLAKEVDSSFVFGVMVTYGVSQGFGGALYRISGNYFWKDTQLVQPSTAQMYSSIISSVWDWKPVWGLLTDLVPISGYHRRPYFLFSGLLSFLSLIMLLLEAKLQNGLAVMLLLLYTLGITIADVTIDAEVAKQSREKPGLATDFQTLCSISSSVGSFFGFSTSGFIVRIMGPKNALGLLSINGALFLLLSFTLLETKDHITSFKVLQVFKKIERTCRSIFKTISCPQVWKPVLYMFISWASSPSISEGKFYWYTDKERGLGFSEEFVGMSFALGSLGGFLGTIAYQNGLKNYPFRRIMLWAQVLVFAGGTVDLILVLRWNQWLHMPDSIFFLFDEIMIQTVGRLKWIPQLVLCAKLCPAGIEGTFFALLMSVDNLGLMTSMWGGAWLQHSLGVKRDNFSNLWLAALIRTLLRLVPLLFLFLVPDTLPSAPQLLPPELSMSRVSDDDDDDNNPDLEVRRSPLTHDQTIELVPYK